LHDALFGDVGGVVALTVAEQPPQVVVVGPAGLGVGVALQEAVDEFYQVNACGDDGRQVVRSVGLLLRRGGDIP